MHIRSSRRLLSALFALIALSFAAVSLASGGGGGGPSYVEGKPNYVVLEPIVVNLRDGSRMRFMQIKMQVLTKSLDAIHAIDSYKPVVTDALLMLFAHQEADTMRDINGREQVRKEALYTLQKLLAEHAGVGHIKSGGSHGFSAPPVEHAATTGQGTAADGEHGAAPAAAQPLDEIDSPIDALYFTDFVIQ